MIGWSVHLGTLFSDRPLPERLGAAAEAGFTHVDLWSPFDADPDDVVASVRASGVVVSAFNLPAGDMAAGERGHLNDPGRRAEVLDDARRSAAFAEAVGCRRINALAGNLLPGQSRATALAETRETLRAVLEIVEPHGVELLVEPLNEEQNPRYLVRSAAEGAELIRAVGSSSVGLLYDAYHAGMSGRSPERELVELGPSIFHVHVADWPGRHEPGTGRLDLAAVVAALDAIGYEGRIGLEFVPSGDVAESLEWLPRDLRADDVRRLVAHAGHGDD